MIKRDFILRVTPERIPDGAGGSAEIEYKIQERYNAHVSITGHLSTAVQAKVTEYGLNSDTILEVIADRKLDDEDKNCRYKWDGKLFQLLRQVRMGNEWFATLQEVNN